MNSCELEIILPFHIFDGFLVQAIQSTISALPANARVITVNTINCQKLTQDISDRIIEINFPGFNYMDALREGFKFSSAKYVGLMNSDDLVHETRFKRQIELLDQKKYNVCATNIRKFHINAEGQLILIPPLLGTPPNNFNEALLLLGSYRADASLCFNRNWAAENRLFESKTDISDWCVGMRVLSRDNTFVVNEDLYFYRMHDRQATRQSKTPTPIEFFEVWKNLNSKLNFPVLNDSEISIVALPLESIKRPTKVANISLWLDKVESHLIFSMPKSDQSFIQNIFARRRILISISTRRSFLRPSDLIRVPPILAEYLRYRSHLRGNLKALVKVVPNKKKWKREKK